MTKAKIDLDAQSIAELNRAMDEQTLCGRDITTHCLERIAALDCKTNAVITLNPDALAMAEALDKERREKGPRSPLHGLPVLLKDNIESKDPMATTAGSLALAGVRASEDSAVCRSLRDGGAVILGKTNLSEWANFRSTRSSSGWSSLGGQTRNPYALDRTAGGSSSGSAVAVAAAMGVAAIGTETDGSILSPSAMTSVVGIKPTVGLIGRTGVIPISHSQDTAGPLSRTVADGAALLNVIARTDPQDPVTNDCDRRRPADYTTALEPEGLKGARIGAVRSLAAFHEGVGDIFAGAIAMMKEAGATIVDNVAVVARADVAKHEYTVMCAEFKAGLDAYLGGLGEGVPVRSLAQLIAYNKAHEGQVMPYFKQEILQASLAAPKLDDRAYLDARDECLRLVREQSLDRAFNDLRLDGLIAPSTCAPWLIDWLNGDNRAGGSAYLAAISGYPAICVPAGYLFGLPVGITFITRAYDEPMALRLAHGFEQRSKIRRPPTFRGSVDFGQRPSSMREGY